MEANPRAFCVRMGHLRSARLVHPPAAEREAPVHVYETPIATVQRILVSSHELSELNVRCLTDLDHP